MNLLSHIIRTNHVRCKLLPSRMLNSALKSRSIMMQGGLNQSKDDYDKDKPVVFSKSQAAVNPKFAITKPITTAQIEDMPWYHPHATLLSLMAFMIYFMVLREENDIDLAIGGETTEDYARKILSLQKSKSDRERTKMISPD